MIKGEGWKTADLALDFVSDSLLKFENYCRDPDLLQPGVSMMASPMATRRLRQDYMRLMRDPVPYVEAAPIPSNILEW